MEYRTDLLPPLIALGLSVALHGGLARWSLAPSLPDPASLRTVEVSYFEDSHDAEPAVGPTASTPREQPQVKKDGEPDSLADRPPKKQAPPPEPQASVPPPKAVPSSPPRPLPPPEPTPQPRVQTKEEVIPKPPPVPKPAPADESVPLSQSVPPAVPSMPVPASKPTLTELMPRPDDVRSPDAHTGVPDPTGAEAREATLSLDTGDLRYKGYVDQLWGAINVAWRWREALLAAGRPGSVLLSFTLTSDGLVEKVTVTQSSGTSLLDREAVEAIRRARFSPFPREWTIERLHLIGQFDYRLE